MINDRFHEFSRIHHSQRTNASRIMKAPFRWPVALWLLVAMAGGTFSWEPGPLAAEESGQVEDSQTVEAQNDIYDGPGLPDLDKAMCEKITAEGIRDLNLVIQSAQSAMDQGLCAVDSDFGRKLLSATLMERATVLIRVINTRSIADRRVQQVRQLVVSDLRRVLAQGNPPVDACLMLGRLMALPGGDPHEAGRMLTHYLATEGLTDMQRAEALITRARVQTNETKALADFDEAIRLMPENTSYLLARALFHRTHKRLEQALTDASVVLEQMPDEANALILQGEILREQGKLEEAITSFNRASELAPQAPGPYQNRGEIYRLQNKYDRAIEQFNKVLEVQPGVLLTLVYRAETYLRAGKPEQALADVDRVLEKQPELVAAHRIRAEVCASLGRLPEAIGEMAQIAKAMPEQIGLKMQLALYYLVNKQTREAIAAYSSVLDVEPEHFLALRSRADSYLNLGEHVRAAADFRRALKINPEDTQLLNNYAWLLATSPLGEVRDGKRAIELATKACTLTEFKQSHILSTLAASYAETGDFESAIEWSRKAVALASANRNTTDDSLTDDSSGLEGNNGEIEAQLAAELASYQHGKPWREVQSAEEEKAPPKTPRPASNDSATPNPQGMANPVNSPEESVGAN